MEEPIDGWSAPNEYEDDELFHVVEKIVSHYDLWTMGRSRVGDMIDLWMLMERLFGEPIDQVFNVMSGMINRPNRRDFRVKVIEQAKALIIASRMNGYRDRDMVLYMARAAIRPLHGKVLGIEEIKVCGIPVQIIEDDAPHPYHMLIGHIFTPWCAALMPGISEPVVFFNGIPYIEGEDDEQQPE